MATSTGPEPAAGLLCGKKILSGTRTYTGINFNRSGDFFYFAEVVADISFGSAFSSPPAVVVTLSLVNGGNSGMVSYVNYDSNEITRIGVIRTSAAPDAAISISWIAIGS